MIARQNLAIIKSAVENFIKISTALLDLINPLSFLLFSHRHHRQESRRLPPHR